MRDGILETDVEHPGGLITEIFGPLIVLASYDAVDIVHATVIVFDSVSRSLTATIHHNPQSGVDTDLTARRGSHYRQLARAGRIPPCPEATVRSRSSTRSRPLIE